MTTATTDVLVVGAGAVGAACAYFAARAGLAVTVIERGGVAGGTTGAGEGNILVSDKAPGPELDLALYSSRLWQELAVELTGPGRTRPGFEYERKGGLVVAAAPDTMAALERFTSRQRAAGVEVEEVAAEQLHAYEPHLAHGSAGGYHYPGDAQVHPARAAAALIRAARDRYGARLLTGTEVRGFRTGADGSLVAVRTTAGDISAGAVINATGSWAGRLSRLAGAPVPVSPRRGFVLVTQPLPPIIRHKVYTADYVANVASSAAALECSGVVESTRAGTVLIGASREQVGFDRTFSPAAVSRLAAQATALFPVLADALVLRTYCGFRPYTPDHLPVIGPDPRVPGLLHACGHEGAGIGLAAGTGALLAQHLTGAPPACDPAPFAPGRFAPRMEPVA